MWCLGRWFSGGLGSVMLTVDQIILEVFSNLNDSVILWMRGEAPVWQNPGKGTQEWSVVAKEVIRWNGNWSLSLGCFPRIAETICWYLHHYFLLLCQNTGKTAVCLHHQVLSCLPPPSGSTTLSSSGLEIILLLVQHLTQKGLKHMTNGLVHC